MMRRSGLTSYQQALGGSSTWRMCVGQELRTSCQIYDNLQAVFLTELLPYLLLSVGSFVAVLCACSTKARDRECHVGAKKANLAITNHQESGERGTCATRPNCQAHTDNLKNDLDRDRQSNRKKQSNRKRAEESVEIANKPRSVTAAARSSSPSSSRISSPSVGGVGRQVVPWAERGLKVLGRWTGGVVAERSVEEMTGVVLGTFVRLVGCAQVALLPLIADEQPNTTCNSIVDGGLSTKCPRMPVPLTAVEQTSGPGARLGHATSSSALSFSPKMGQDMGRVRRSKQLRPCCIT